MRVKSESEVAQSCPTLSDRMDCSPPGSSVHGIFQARVLEWGAIAFSNIYIYIYIHKNTCGCIYILLILISLISCYKMFSEIPYAIEKVLVVYPFYI